MGKGVGNVLYRLSKSNNISIREAGIKLAEGEYLNELDNLFKGGESSESKSK